MKKGDIQEILARLSRELQGAEDVDIDARRKTQELRPDLDEFDDTEGSKAHSQQRRARLATRLRRAEMGERLDVDEFNPMDDEKFKAGLRLAAVDQYDTDDGRRFLGAWRPGTGEQRVSSG